MQIQSNVFVGIKPDAQQQSLIGLAKSNKIDDHDQKQTGINLLAESCDFVLLPVTNSRYRETVMKQLEKYIHLNDPFQELKISEPQIQDIAISPFNNGNNNKDSGSTIASYIGLLSAWVELESNDTIIREMSYQVLLNECKYAKYIGITNLILAPPHNISNLKYYAQMISRILNHETINDPSSNSILSISLPLYEDSDPLATWDLWNTIRKLCGYHPSLMVSLALPRGKTLKHVVSRWLTEPVSCLLLSSSIFATNQYDYPVLHKFNQNLIMNFQKVNGSSQLKSNALVIILHGMEKYVNFIKGGELAYLEYVNYLLKKNDKLALTNSTSFTNNFRFNLPQLMNPLMPHSENLTNSVYSIFEKDSVKYDLYKQAFRQAIVDFMNQNKQIKKIVILVAGAGRGPLVEKTINILKEFNIMNKVELIALEKNAQAFLYLQKKNFEYWNNFVTLINEDMRKWKSNDKVDICISELLGSFGCNELSPECLWNIEQNHSKPTTIFIPESYSSYIAPVTTPLLYQKLSQETFSENNYLESPWIIHDIPYDILSTRVNELWTFKHPLGTTTNARDTFSKSITTEFKIKHRGEIHGIVGFFTAQLYKDIAISILPDDTIVKKESDVKFEKMNHTKGLTSWSPIIMPLREPLLITDDTEVSILCSRNLDTKKVWYEWSIESYIYLVVSQRLPKSGHGAKYVDDTDDTQQSKINRTHSQHAIGVSGNNNRQQQQQQEFESAIDDNGFMPTYENGWQSVQNIHEQLEQTVPEPNIRGTHTSTNMQKQASMEPETEVHIRVKTGTSKLHNTNGQCFSIPLS